MTDQIVVGIGSPGQIEYRVTVTHGSFRKRWACKTLARVDRILIRARQTYPYHDVIIETRLATDWTYDTELTAEMVPVDTLNP